LIVDPDAELAEAISRQRFEPASARRQQLGQRNGLIERAQLAQC